MIHVVDWGPTLLSAVKENLSQQQSALVNTWISEDKDGMDLWNELMKGESSKRTEFLYNIDPLFDDGASAIIGGAGIRYFMIIKLYYDEEIIKTLNAD